MFWGVTNPSSLGMRWMTAKGSILFSRQRRSKACAMRLCARLKNVANVLAMHAQTLNEHAPTWNLAHRLAVFTSSHFQITYYLRHIYKILKDDSFYNYPKMVQETGNQPHILKPFPNMQKNTWIKHWIKCKNLGDSESWSIRYIHTHIFGPYWITFNSQYLDVF